MHRSRPPSNFSRAFNRKMSFNKTILHTTKLPQTTNKLATILQAAAITKKTKSIIASTRGKVNRRPLGHQVGLKLTRSQVHVQLMKKTFLMHVIATTSSTWTPRSTAKLGMSLRHPSHYNNNHQVCAEKA